MTTDVGEVRYLLLADRATPYLLARVRWPDVAQAISAGCPDWLDDIGLLDLPYDPNVITVSFAQAASVAAGWGRQLRAEPATGVPSFIRRMPANWSDLTPGEREAFGIEPPARRRVSGRRLRRVLRSQAEGDAPVPAAADPFGHGDPFSGADPFADGPALANGTAHSNGNAHSNGTALANGDAGARQLAAAGRHRVAGTAGGAGSPAAERRRRVRVRVDGRAHIRSGESTISAPLVDLSESGVRCVLPGDVPLAVTPGQPLSGPIVLEGEAAKARICLAVPGRISWILDGRSGTHFGVTFGDLDEGEIDGVQRFLVTAGSRRG